MNESIVYEQHCEYAALEGNPGSLILNLQIIVSK